MATATSTPLHRGRTLIVIETEIARDDGKLAAKVDPDAGVYLLVGRQLYDLSE